MTERDGGGGIAARATKDDWSMPEIASVKPSMPDFAANTAKEMLAL